MVCFDHNTKEEKDYSSAKILIDTCSFLPIQGQIYFSVDGVGFDIYVKEICRDFGYPLSLDNMKKMLNLGVEAETAKAVPGKQKDRDEDVACQDGSGNGDTWLDGKMMEDNTFNPINEDVMEAGDYHDCGVQIQIGEGVETASGNGGKCVGVHQDNGSQTKPIEDDRVTANVVSPLVLSRKKMFKCNKRNHGLSFVAHQESMSSGPPFPLVLGQPKTSPLGQWFVKPNLSRTTIYLNALVKVWAMRYCMAL